MLLFGKPCVNLPEHFFQIAHDRNVRSNILVDFGRIDIDMKHFGVFRKFFRISNDAVGKSGAQRNQKIAFTDAEIRGFRAVHADHAGIIRIIPVVNPFSH